MHTRLGNCRLVHCLMNILWLPEAYRKINNKKSPHPTQSVSLEFERTFGDVTSTHFLLKPRHRLRCFFVVVSPFPALFRFIVSGWRKVCKLLEQEIKAAPTISPLTDRSQPAELLHHQWNDAQFRKDSCEWNISVMWSPAYHFTLQPTRDGTYLCLVPPDDWCSYAFCFWVKWRI